ncbi:MAG: acyl-CoA thioesterase [Opitutales bacterium]|nr:acyl-CoA thioesterase [Opitutales bacterium]
MISSETKIRVRFAETDAMRVAYHGNYFAWFEVSRVEMLDSVGLSYKELDAKGCHLPVLEVHSKFIRPAKFDDVLTIRACVKERPGVKIKIEYEVFCGDEKLCEGYTIHAFVNSQGVPIKPPAAFINRLRQYFD